MARLKNIEEKNREISKRAHVTPRPLPRGRPGLNFCRGRDDISIAGAGIQILPGPE